MAEAEVDDLELIALLVAEEEVFEFQVAVDNPLRVEVCDWG